MTTSTHVLVMAKTPVAGRVKTRLSPPCTPEEAAFVAAAALADTLGAVVACSAERRILALDGEPGDWIPEGIEVIAQVDGRFDQRLTAAWAHAGGPGLQIGMDTPQVTADLLDACLRALVEGEEPPDAVLGPAADGGWWAIGFQRPHPEAFLGVPMSDARTGEAQADRLAALGLRIESLPSLRDMDTFEDAVEIVALAPTTATAAAVRTVLGGPAIHHPVRR